MSTVQSYSINGPVYNTNPLDTTIKYIFLLSLFIIALSASFTVRANSIPQPQNTYKYELENGLIVIVREDHRAPIAATQVWYKVGASDEPNGITGISHALEHMMFRGTQRYPQDAFSRLIAIGGGDQNAVTADDFTAYYQLVNTNLLKICFELEADRMANLAIPSDAFEQEIKVVMEERRLRIEDNPDALAKEHLVAAAHISNPYHHPTIGWMNDIQHLEADDLRRWYKTWYAPNNAVLVVVGDVDKNEVLNLAKTYFGPLKPIALPKRKPRQEIAPTGQKRIKVNLYATVPRLWISYNVPSIQSAADAKEAYALFVLLMALDGGNSARFSEELIRNQAVAASISSSYNLFNIHETLMTFSAIPNQGHTLADLESAFLAQIMKLQNEPILAEELTRIKLNLVADFIYQRDSVDDQAFLLGMLESTGLSFKLAENFSEQIEKVTAQDVQQVAQKYLTENRQTMAELIPPKSGPL